MEFYNLTIEELKALKSIYKFELKSIDRIIQELLDLSLSSEIESIHNSVLLLKKSYEDDLEKIYEKIDDGKAGEEGDFIEKK